MAMFRPVNRRAFRAIAALACVSLGACEPPVVPAQHQASSEECGLAAKALERMITREAPLSLPWHLDFSAPRATWERGAFVRPAMLEQAGTQHRYTWLELAPEIPSRWPRFLRHRDLDPKGVKGPSVQMAHAFATVTPRNAATCPEVYAYAASKKALPTQSENRHAPGEPTHYWFMVEQAVISSDGKEAVVSLVMDSVGTLVFYRKQPDGTWREAAFVHSWIS